MMNRFLMHISVEVNSTGRRHADIPLDLAMMKGQQDAPDKLTGDPQVILNIENALEAAQMASAKDKHISASALNNERASEADRIAEYLVRVSATALNSERAREADRMAEELMREEEEEKLKLGREQGSQFLFMTLSILT